MGSRAKRHKLVWRGDPESHALITRDGAPSARSLCNIAAEDLTGTSKDRCSNCTQMITHNVIVAWADPGKRR